MIDLITLAEYSLLKFSFEVLRVVLSMLPSFAVVKFILFAVEVAAL